MFFEICLYKDKFFLVKFDFLIVVKVFWVWVCLLRCMCVFVNKSVLVLELILFENGVILL